MLEVWRWLSDNHQAISTIASVLTLLVWIFYLQVLWGSYHHRLRPRVLINWGGGSSLNSRCIITNMSSEPVYLYAILIDMNTGKREILRSLSGLAPRKIDSSDQRRQILQGPLAGGEMIDIGSFRELLEQVSPEDPLCDDNRPLEFRITIAGSYTSEDALVAAERTFVVKDGSLGAPVLDTTQIRSVKKRRRIERMLGKAESW